MLLGSGDGRGRYPFPVPLFGCVVYLYEYQLICEDRVEKVPSYVCGVRNSAGIIILSEQ